METLEKFKVLFLDVWNDGISGVNISEILIGLFFFFSFFSRVFAKFVVKRFGEICF